MTLDGVKPQPLRGQERSGCSDTRDASGMPIVTVGLPVRNGSRYLEQALTAILSQEYPTLAVAIFDNASTDNTKEICRRVCDGCQVTYHRFDEDCGAIANFNRAFHLTSGELFCWAAHDDRMLPGFIQRCVSAIEDNPDAAMCVTSVRFIGRDGEYIGHFEETQELASPDVRHRLRSLLRRRGWFLSYGLARRSVLERTELLRPVPGTDVVLLWELLLRHRFCVVEDELLEYRIIRGSGRTSAHLAQKLVPGRGPHWYRLKSLRLWRELWMASRSADLPRHVRLTAKSELVRWLFTWYWRALVYDDLCGECALAAQRRQWARAGGIAVLMGLVQPVRSWVLVREGDIKRRLGLDSPPL